MLRLTTGLVQDHLKPLEHLRELYLLGNPSQSNWTEGLHEYVVASLPQLELLDGKEIHRSDRIKALQVFPDRLQYVREQAVLVRAVKEAKRREEEELLAEAKAKEEELADVIHVVDGKATDISDQPAKSEKKSVLASQEKVPYTPETRREMYMELAEQKEEEEARKRENMPQERNAEAEHEEALRKVRMQEERDDGTIRQCNEGKWEFRLLDEILDIILEVDLPRFLDTSLIDVDVHPSFVSIVIKNKIFRLRFPELVHSDAGKAERSKVTGTLRLTLPKAHVTPTQQLRAQLHREELAKLNQPRSEKVKPSEDSNQRTTRVSKSSKKLSDEVSSWLCIFLQRLLTRGVCVVALGGRQRKQEELFTSQSQCCERPRSRQKRPGEPERLPERSSADDARDLENPSSLD